MKKIVYWFYLVIGLWGNAQAQKDWQVEFYTSPKGVFIQVGELENMTDDIILERKESDFVRLAVLKRPASKRELSENIQRSQLIFGVDAPKNQGLDEVWEKFRRRDLATLRFIQSVPSFSYVFGLSFLDPKIEVGKSISYRITVGKTQKIVESGVYYPSVKAPFELRQVESEDRKVRLWVGTQSKKHGWFRFVLYRKPRTEVTFQEVQPVVSFQPTDSQYMLLDTTLKFYGLYHYKIMVRDLLGNEFPEVSLTNVACYPPNLQFQIIKFEAKNRPEVREVELAWEIAPSNLIQSVTLLKSEKLEGDYRRLSTFSPQEKRWTDEIEIANELNFYRFDILDIFGQTHQSIRLKHIYDLDIPATPVRDVSILNKGNRPLLTISAGDAHTRGFFVFRKSAEKDSWIQISDFIPAQRGSASFLDSSAVLETSTLYYAVRAENDTYQKSALSNELSFRDHLALAKRADLEPPSDLSVRLDDQRPVLYWENKRASNSVIVGYNVYRRAVGETDFTRVNANPLSVRMNYFQDTLSLTKVQYDYYVESLDQWGSRSEKSLPARLDLSLHGNVYPDEVGHEIDAQSIQIIWTAVSSPSIKQINVYRSENGGKPILLGSRPVHEKQFRDRNVTKGKEYVYQLTVVDLEKNERPIQDFITVSF